MKKLASRRGKPVVAGKNQDDARENIKNKIRCIWLAVEGSATDGLRQGKLERGLALQLLQQCPKSENEFNLWNSSSLAEAIQSLVPAFKGNAQRTLRLNDDLRSLAEKARQASKVKPDKAQRSKLQSAANLKERLAEAVLLKDIAMAELAEERRGRSNEVARVMEMVNGTRSSLNDAVKQLALLREENARLLNVVQTQTIETPMASATVTRIGPRED